MTIILKKDKPITKGEYYWSATPSDTPITGDVDSNLDFWVGDECDSVDELGGYWAPVELSHFQFETEGK